jgi:hypothetical protein
MENIQIPVKYTIVRAVYEGASTDKTYTFRALPHTVKIGDLAIAETRDTYGLVRIVSINNEPLSTPYPLKWILMKVDTDTLKEQQLITANVEVQ